MRKLMWFTIGFTAACAAGVYLLSGIWLFLLGVCCLVVAVGLFFVKTDAAKITALILAGSVAAFLWLFGYDWLYLSHARMMDGKTIETTVTATDFSYETDYGIAGDGQFQMKGKTYRVRYYLYSKELVAPGDKITGEVRLRYTADGGSKEPTYHRGEGIFLLGYCDDETVVSRADQIPARYFAAVLRQRITALLNATFPADTLAFARALLLGDSSLLTYEMDTAFSASGIRHVIAVSGLHVSILFCLVYLLLGERRVLTPIIGIAVLLLFAAVAGFTPSVVRACIMQGIMLLALLFNKEYDPPTALSVAVLTMLVVNPIAVTSVSLQLSAGCMVGIFLFTGRIHDYFLDEKRFGPAKGKSLKAKLIRWVVGSVSVTLGAMSVTTPLCAVYFGSVSLVGILTNLLTLWIISFVFYGIMAACVAGAVWLPLGEGIAWLISWPIRFVTGTATFLSSFPIAAVYTCSIYIVLWIVGCYVLLSVFLFCRKKHPILLVCCMAVSLCVCLGASWLEPRMDDYRMTVMDVGQGQCILLQNDDRYYLVDCGGDYGEDAADTAAQLLLSQGIYEIDGLILTHYDEDHAGGAEAFLSRIRVNAIYLPEMDDPSGIREALTDKYSDSIIWIAQDREMPVSGANITLYSTSAGNSDNESSLCVLFQPENCDILITADRSGRGERALLAQTQFPDIEILVVGHHGAKSSTSLELLAATQPEIAVISVGKNNNFGHPSREVLDRLALFGCQVYRTDIQGTITFRG